MDRKNLILWAPALALGFLAVQAMDKLPQPYRHWVDIAFLPAGLVILAFSLKRMKAKRPDFRYGPGRKKSRRYLIAGLILFPLSFAWLIGATVIAATWYPKSGWAMQAVLWPALLMMCVAAILIAIPVTGWLRRSIGLKSLDGD